MPVSGLVFNLSNDDEGEAAFAALKSRPELTFGKGAGKLVPAALETSDVQTSRALHEWIASQPGVKFVDVVWVNFEEDEETDVDAKTGTKGEGEGFGRNAQVHTEKEPQQRMSFTKNNRTL
jgi:hypothetical protein